MKAMFDGYDHPGLVGNPLTLQALLGREPRTLRAYFKELAAQPPAGEGGQNSKRHSRDSDFAAP